VLRGCSDETVHEAAESSLQKDSSARVRASTTSTSSSRFGTKRQAGQPQQGQAKLPSVRVSLSLLVTLTLASAASWAVFVQILHGPAVTCRSTVEGEDCHKQVLWAMQTGVHEHPEWYPGLDAASSAEDFQSLLHQRDPASCPQPCNSSTAFLALNMLFPWVLNGGNCPPGFDSVGGRCLYRCNSSLALGQVFAPSKKGLIVDDFTLLNCPNKIPYLWPHTQERITSLRLLSLWRADWAPSKREAAWAAAIDFVRANGIRILVGVEHTCNETQNDLEWAMAKDFLARIGPEPVMAVAIGDEMELKWTKEEKVVSAACLDKLWIQHGFLGTYIRRVSDLESIAGFAQVPVTTILSGFALAASRSPFYEEDIARVNTFLKEVTHRYGRRFVFCFNIHPYVGPSQEPDPGTDGKECLAAIKAAACLREDCVLSLEASDARRRMRLLTGNDDHALWITKTGWSHPQSSPPRIAMPNCSQWSSRRVFKAFYESFLSWNLSVGSARPPDHVFYLAARDSVSSDGAVRAGLIRECGAVECKLQEERCRTSMPGESCYNQVQWAVQHGIYHHPDWYPGLSPASNLVEFQAHLYQTGRGSCPEPCGVLTATSDVCHTAVQGDACFPEVEWAMSSGIKHNPHWYPGLNEASTFGEFQAHLNRGSHGSCPRPCATSRDHFRNLLERGHGKCPQAFHPVDGRCLYACHSDIPPYRVIRAKHKGLCIDDTTFLECPDQIPYLWPHTRERITSLRLFTPWKPKWPASRREEVWAKIIDFVHINNARVLIGVEHSCDDHQNELEWQIAREFLTRIGAGYVMAVAIGNEMELLWAKDEKFVPKGCLDRLWVRSGFLKTYMKRVEELDRIPGFKGVPITTVLGGFALAPSKLPFYEEDIARINTFLHKVTRKYGRRFVFSFNFYPYFGPSLQADPGTKGRECWNMVRAGVCLRENCMVAREAIDARKKMQQLTGRPDDVLWITETGWSHPKSVSLLTGLKDCDEWSSRRTFKTFYENFLAWDLSMGKVRPPDHVFYFTARDSVNFEQAEHFGLITHCGTDRCKLQSECRDAVPGDFCHQQVQWAMQVGVREHPEWYPELGPLSQFGHFQKHLYQRAQGGCPEPCGSPPEAEVPCRAVGQEEACFREVSWAMRTGVREHPDWYPGLGPGAGFAAFQAQLHRAGRASCPPPCFGSYDERTTTTTQLQERWVIRQPEERSSCRPCAPSEGACCRPGRTPPEYCPNRAKCCSCGSERCSCAAR